MLPYICVCLSVWLCVKMGSENMVLVRLLQIRAKDLTVCYTLPEHVYCTHPKHHHWNSHKQASPHMYFAHTYHASSRVEECYTIAESESHMLQVC